MSYQEDMTSKKFRSFLGFALLTIILLFVTHHIMVLIHEWGHSVTAWLLGYKENPFAIYYGDWTLYFVYQAVDYKRICAEGHPYLVSLIAIVPIFVGLCLVWLSFVCIRHKKIQKKKWLYGFFFWFLVMNLGQIYSYIPWRTFSLTGDIHDFVTGLSISPWTVFVPGTLIVIALIWLFLRVEVPRAYLVLRLTKAWAQATFLFLILLVLFGYYGGMIYLLVRGNYLAEVVPGAIVIIFFFLCYPKRKWVKKILKK